MSSRFICLKLSGPILDDKIDLKVFADQLKNLEALLKTIKQESNLEVDFLTVNISHGSPYNISVEVAGEQASMLVDIMGQQREHLRNLHNNIHKVSDDKDIDISIAVLNNYKNLAAPLTDKTLKNVSLVINDKSPGNSTTDLTTNHYQLIANHIKEKGKDNKSYNEDDTKFFGILEEINLHGAKRFAVYDGLNNKINCAFAGDILDEVKRFIGLYVEIKGKAHYSSGSYIPEKVEVISIEEYQENDDRVTLDKLYGLGKNFAKDKSAVELIREIRDRD